jgi:hypothetical protein
MKEISLFCKKSSFLRIFSSLYPCEKSLLNFEDGPPPYFPPDIAAANPSAPKTEPKINPIQAPQAPIPPADNLDLPELPGACFVQN